MNTHANLTSVAASRQRTAQQTREKACLLMVQYAEALVTPMLRSRRLALSRSQGYPLFKPRFLSCIQLCLWTPFLDEQIGLHRNNNDRCRVCAGIICGPSSIECTAILLYAGVCASRAKPQEPHDDPCGLRRQVRGAKLTCSMPSAAPKAISTAQMTTLDRPWPWAQCTYTPRPCLFCASDHSTPWLICFTVGAAPTTRRNSGLPHYKVSVVLAAETIETMQRWQGKGH